MSTQETRALDRRIALERLPKGRLISEFNRAQHAAGRRTVGGVPVKFWSKAEIASAIVEYEQAVTG